MATETGRVLAVEADALWVEIIRRSACGGCAGRSQCGRLLPTGDSGVYHARIRVAPESHAAISGFRVDDRVRLGLSDRDILRGALLAYGLPWLGVLAGALAGAWWFTGNQDVAAVVGASAGLLLGFALLRWHGARQQDHPALQPVLCGLATHVEHPLGRC